MAKQRVTQDRMQFAGATVLVPSGGVFFATAKFQTNISSVQKTGIEIKSVEFKVYEPDIPGGLNAPEATIRLFLHAIERNRFQAGVFTYENLFPVGTYAQHAWYGDAQFAAPTANLIQSGDHLYVPPEPLLAHPDALFFTGVGQTLAADIHAYCRVGFVYKDLTDDEYQDILQGILIQNVI